MNRNAHDVAEWLRSDACKAHNVRPCRLTFDTGGKNTQTIEGAAYEQDRGLRFMILDPPKCYVKRTRVEKGLMGSPTVIVSHPVCFVLSTDDTAEWYVACYWLGDEENRQAEPTDAKPFGVNVILCPWSKGKIDDHEETKYRRIPVQVEWLDTAE